MLSSVVRSRRVGLLILASLSIFCLGEDGLVWAQATKSKGKVAAKNLPELEDDYFKYAVALTGEESPIAAGKTVVWELESESRPEQGSSTDVRRAPQWAQWASTKIDFTETSADVRSS